ncbi:MAG: hypothetical protein EXR71_16140 [Myxococcales bacterium]|nr:hypothetical protein [Myxococcales bacterium]
MLQALSRPNADGEAGKTWAGELNRSKAGPGSRFFELATRETVFLGRAKFQDVAVTGRAVRATPTD